MTLFYPNKVYAYFKDRFVLGKASPKGWMAFNCPLCGKERKAAVHVVIQHVKCWSCGMACNICQFIETVENVSYQEAKALLNQAKPSALDLDVLTDIVYDKQLQKSQVTLPDGWQSILDGVGSLGDRARAYLEQRKFDLEVLDFKGFGYCNKHNEDQLKDFFGYIVVPFKKDGLLTYYLGRDYVGNFLRYKNPPSDWVGKGKSEVIYNEEALYLYKTVYVVEGWSDAETIGKRGTATLGWNLSKNQMDKYYKSVANTLVFIPDAGTDKATGQSYYQKAVQTATSFIDSNKSIFVVDLNIPAFKDIITKHGDNAKDICEIGWNLVHKQYKQTEQLTWNTAMSILTN